MTTPLEPFISTVNKLEWYNIIILLAQVSHIVNNSFSFSGMVTSLNNKESNKMYFLLMFPFLVLLI